MASVTVLRGSSMWRRGVVSEARVRGCWTAAKPGWVTVRV